VALLVQKFGGTSVGTTERIEAVAELVIRTRQAGHQVVVVVSAMAGETNRLLGLAQHIDERAASRELDVLAASGEQVTVALLAIALIKRGYPAISLLADQVGILTDNKFGKARILSVSAERMQQELEQGHIVIVPGFQGRDGEGNLTTLGRGGSDTTAVALAAALQADECQIYTDVDGVYSIDPRLSPQARRLPQISFADMLELASLGAKVLHSRSVEYAGLYRVPLRVLSTFAPDQGTLMVYEDQTMSLPLISGVACQSQQQLLQVSGLTPESMTMLLAEFARLSIETDMLQQQGVFPEQLTLRCALSKADVNQATAALMELEKRWAGLQWQFVPQLGKLSVVGIGIKSHPVLISTIFNALREMNLNLLLLATAETRFSVLIQEQQLESAAKQLHQQLVVDN
jgi:aspartate kinase